MNNINFKIKVYNLEKKCQINLCQAVIVFKLLIFFYLWFNLVDFIVKILIKGTLFLLLTVMFSRIYFLCHYLMDTVVGAI